MKTDSKTVIRLQTWKILGMIQILIKVTSSEDQKQEQVGGLLEKANVKK